MKLRRTLSYASAPWLAIASLAAFALSTDEDQPMDISSESLEYDEGSNTVIHRGSVVAQQGSRCLIGDLLTLTFNDSNRIESAHLEGAPAQFRVRPDDKDSDVVGRSVTIDFDAVQNLLTLEGDATLFVDGNEYRASRMTYDIDREFVDTVEQRAVIRVARDAAAQSAAGGPDACKRE